MLDLSIVEKRYFPIRFADGSIINIEPCKLKLIKKFDETSNNPTNEEILDIIIEILNKNKEKRKFTKKWIYDNLTVDDMELIYIEYFGWMAQIRKDPN